MSRIPILTITSFEGLVSLIIDDNEYTYRCDGTLARKIPYLMSKSPFKSLNLLKTTGDCIDKSPVLKKGY